MEKSEIAKMAVYWYCVNHIGNFRKLRANGRLDTVQQFAAIASELSQREPLYATMKTFTIPEYATNLSGLNIIAVMVSALWVCCGEDENLAGALIRDWPDLPLFARLAPDIEEAA